MIEAADKTLAEHEAEAAGKPWVLLARHGWQPGFESLPGRFYYNVVGGNMTIGSTVTIETLLKQGYRVEVVE